MKFKTKYLLYVGYCIYMLSNVFIESKMCDISGVGTMLRFLKYVGVLFCIFASHQSLTVSKQKAIEFLCVLFMAIANMLFVQGGSGLIEIMIIIFCIVLSEVKTNEVFACGIITLLGGHLFVIILSLLGILKDEVSSRWFGNYMGAFFSGEYVRHQMGFLSSNQIPLTLMIVYLMIIIYKQKNVTFIEHAFFLIINFWCFFNFGARVSFILINFTFILYEIIVFFEKKNKKSKCSPFFWTIYLSCAIISIFSAYVYNPTSNMWKILNEIFYNRIRWSHAAIDKYGISLIGYGLNAGKATGNFGENLIDNAYILVLIQKGVIIATIVILFWCYITYKAEKEKNAFLVLSLVIIAVASLIDDHLITYKMIPFYAIAFLNDYTINHNQQMKVKPKRHYKIIHIKRGI